MSIALNVDERRWRAENDARILADAIKIQRDPTRMNEAIQAANRMAEEKKEEASAMINVARRGQFNSGGTKKPTQKKKSTGNLHKKKTSKNNEFNVFQKI